MNALDKLILNKTKVYVCFNDKYQRDLTGIVIGYKIEDYYFHEKNENIYISVNIDPLDDIKEGEESDIFNDIPLECITKL